MTTKAFPDSARTSSRPANSRSEEHTSELQSRLHLVCRLLLENNKHQFALIGIAHAYPTPGRTTNREHVLLVLLKPVTLRRLRPQNLILRLRYNLRAPQPTLTL